MSPEDKFCASCAAPLEMRQVADKERPVCARCQRVVYYDPKIAAIAIIRRDSGVLMVRRAVQTGYGLWSMPGGYVDRGEVVEEAAAREVWEETGLLIEVDGTVGIFSQPGYPVLVAAFSAREVGGVLAPGPESLEVGFFAPDRLPPLAFPQDQLILQCWQAMLTNGRS